jgi:hypothetical protein
MKAPSAVKQTKLPFETSMVAEEKCNDVMCPEPLGDLLVTDMDEYHSDISPAALDGVGDVAATPSAGAGSDKLQHPTCFHHYLHQSSFDRRCVLLYGPNGPNTAPNSETVLINWWTTGDTWCVYCGGKKGNRKTTTMKPWKMLSKQIAATVVTVTRKAKAVGAKITRMEGEYEKAFDFVTITD